MKIRNLFCHVLAILKLHKPDCNKCDAIQKCWGTDVRKRLEELGQPPQTTVATIPMPAREPNAAPAASLTVIPSEKDCREEYRSKTG